MTDVARPSLRAAPAKLPTSTTVRKTRNWSSVGVPRLDDISIFSNVMVQIMPVSLDRPSTLDRAHSSIEPEHIARASSQQPRSFTGCDSRTGVLHAQRSSLHAPSSLNQASAEIQTLLL